MWNSFVRISITKRSPADSSRSRNSVNLPCSRRRSRYRGFFRCWTRKEAYIKAQGAGLSLPLHQFDVSLKPGDRNALLSTRPDSAEAARWSLQDVPASDGYVAALCVRGHGWRLKSKSSRRTASQFPVHEYRRCKILHSPMFAEQKRLALFCATICTSAHHETGSPRKTQRFTLYPYQFTVQWRKPAPAWHLRGDKRCKSVLVYTGVNLGSLARNKFVVSLACSPQSHVRKSSLIPSARR